jgi:hypothetical protein
MAKLQTLRQQHADWKDRVQIIALSIDDELSQAREHLAKRGWTNSFNTWAGPGAWTSPSAKEYRLHGVPTLYIIDPKGKVVQAGHPMGIRIAEAVTSLLR